MQAHQIMSRRVVTIRPESSVADAIRLMLSHHFSGLPVTDAGGKLVGIVCESDFLRRTEIGTQHARKRLLSLLLGTDRFAREFVKEHGQKVEQIMTPDPVTVAEDTPLDQIAALMESRRVNHILVMHEGRIVGMITSSDFVSAVAGPLTKVPGSLEDDNQIRQSALAAMSDAAWHPSGLNISVRDGVVTLRGVVRSEAARQAAVVACETIPGVLEVEDRLCLQTLRADPEDDYGGGDIASLPAETSTADDEPL
ncbi:CBS domain-containing protein [Bradyrhizobium betae]|uniref:CBS domain-containing protein n=1 Tax=Bradyrhizobium betae TaxID=244734 RepID=A0A5P6PF28_9BRAD|nr:CBS domain-containing protein [Bradyrhizobium betae]MCS3726031.1 CBS domain-containing protein [Bradyrhizobium betae]QFI76871.1 CBS domain-containing protein [Bradyrhizobium betae]